MNNIPLDKLTCIVHHISAIKDSEPYPYNDAFGIRDVGFAACELTWMYFFPNTVFPEIVRLLGRYDCAGHKLSNEELLKLDTLRNIDPLARTEKEFRELMKLSVKQTDSDRVLKFQYGARDFIFNYKDAGEYLTKSITKEVVKYDFSSQQVIEDVILDRGSILYSYLSKEANVIYSTKQDVYFTDENFSKTFKFALVNRERFNPINFKIDYHKDGYDGFACFHYNNGVFIFSIYNDNGEVDCSKIAKQFGGGGHKGASGFRLDIDNFKKLLKL